MNASLLRRRALVPATAAILLAGGLSGCAQMEQAGAAATVDGSRISIDDVQTATREITAQPDLDKVTSNQVAMFLAYGRIAEPLAAKYGKTVSDAVVLKAAPGFKGASPATMATLRSNILLSQNLQTDSEFSRAFLAEVKKADITINPRYGTIDPGAQLPITPVSVPWIKTAPGSGGAVAPGSGNVEG